MDLYVGITDGDWHELLSRQDGLDEVNFWQPGGSHQFRALQPGGLFLFKLHAPRRAIVGGGFFAHASLLPASLAWASFGIGNGATTLAEMRRRIEKYKFKKKQPPLAHEDYQIGCILLEQPFFFKEDEWIREPEDWHANIVQGKGYDTATPVGRRLWDAVHERIARTHAATIDDERFIDQVDTGLAARFGKPALVAPRLGQGSFRIVVTDAYQRRCAVTKERTLPVLEAAHIRPYSEKGEHRVDNGLLLRLPTKDAEEPGVGFPRLHNEARYLGQATAALPSVSEIAND